MIIENFIGVVYKKTKMIANISTLKNLPKIKACLRLLYQVRVLQSNRMSFMCNPFGDVFVSKKHLKQVQIVNPELLINYSYSDINTQKWTIEYVTNIINSDDSIDIKITDNNITIPDLINILEKYSEKLVNYCPYHGIYYASECKECKTQNDGIQSKCDYVYLQDIKRNNSNKSDEGGESIIYNYSKDSVVKIFKEEVNMKLKIDVLSKILDRKEKLEAMNKSERRYEYIIPQKIVKNGDTGRIVGYIMKKVEGFPISDLKNKNRVKELGFKRKDVIEMLISIGKGIETLHNEFNIFIGDLNGRNILFDRNKKIYFIDFDGMGVENLSPEFWTNEYIDPISKRDNNITPKDDWYSFAIQAFYYLTYTHPFNGIDKKELDIVEKMERKMSLLGNHNMLLPKVAEPWDWMTQDLINIFLDIFEGNTRVSIVPYLEACLLKLKSNELREKKSYKLDKELDELDAIMDEEIKKYYTF